LTTVLSMMTVANEIARGRWTESKTYFKNRDFGSPWKTMKNRKIKNMALHHHQ